MTTKEKSLNISKSQAQKVLDEIINSEINKMKLVQLRADDITIERLVERGLTDTQARKLVRKLLKDNLVDEFCYTNSRKSVAKVYRVKNAP